MSKGNAPLFADFDFSRLGDFEKAFAAFQMPLVEGQSLAEAQRKNVEALTQANKVAIEGWQSLAQRQTEITRQVIADFTTALQDLAGAESVEGRLARQTEMVKEGFEQAVSNARELTELGVKSQSEALDLLNQRFTEGLDELKTALTKTNGKR